MTDEAEINRLRALLFGIRDVIPICFLRANDAPGATGPTDSLDLIGAVRSLVKKGRELETEVDSLRAEVARLQGVDDGK